MVPDCGFKPLDDSISRTKAWVGDNDILIKELKKVGYFLPDDYFDRVDSRGLYKGKRLKVTKLRDSESQPSSISTLNVTKFYFPLKIWVHANNAGNSPVTNGMIDERINATIDIYDDHNSPIVFYRLPIITVIPSSPHNILETEAEEETMFSTYNQAGAINVHFVADGPANGSADGISSRSCWIRAGAAMLTLAHELGHCMGLLHTHNAFPPCAGQDNDGCADCWQEPVSRTRTQPLYCGIQVGKKKCAVYGDQLCDTPGEGSLEGLVNNDCTHDPLGTDNWGATWQPMQYNLMSLGRTGTQECRDIISPGQLGVMVASKPFIPSTTPGYTMTGNDAVCGNLIYTYSVPVLAGVTNYTWILTPGATIISGQGTRQVQIQFTLEGQHRITILPNCCFPLVSKNVQSIQNLSINGSTLVATSSLEFYSTNLVQGASYSWSMPSDWILTGDGGSSIEVQTGSVPGQDVLAVTMSVNGCSKTAFLNVNVQNMFAKSTIDNKTSAVSEIETFLFVDMKTGDTVMEYEGSYEDALLLVPRGFYSIKKISNKRVAETKLIKD